MINISKTGIHIRKMQRIIQIETSQFDPAGYWVPGSEYFAADVTIEYPETMDWMEDDELDESAEDDNIDYVYFVNIQDKE
jgi:hypothetical protein